MAEIRMPSLGADMEAGTLIEWTVVVGDVVSRGSVVALVETQKATMEIESFVDGTIEALLVEPGAKVPVGTPLARVMAADTHATDATGASVPVRDAASSREGRALAAHVRDVAIPAEARRVEPTSTTHGNDDAAGSRRVVDNTVLPAPLAIATSVLARVPTPETATNASREIVATSADARTRSSPAARKLARELAIDLRSVAPSGPHGAIVLRDVERAARAPVTTPRRTPSVTGPVRDAIAAAMARSKREIPHYYLSHTISVEAALASLATINATRLIADRILPAALWLHAVTRALWEVPELNGFFIDGAYRPSEAVHLGTAIALRTGGVIAPAIVDADPKSLDELMAALRDLVARARAGRLRASELTGATITVTSLGDRGCDAVWGVINPPQVAIVGVGAIVERPWSCGGQVRSHHVATVTLSADHRVTDGHRGGRFLAEIDRILQEPITP
jgi:pyruvate dehydrogenase E2 component (dihydrolipoamide acetyltransferase)